MATPTAGKIIPEGDANASILTKKRDKPVEKAEDSASTAGRRLRERQMDTMTAEERKERAKKAATARWSKKEKPIKFRGF